MRAAKLAAAARALKEAAGAGAPFSLVFMTDRRRISNPEPIIRALPPGSAVIYRDYDDPRREGIARRLLAIARARGLLFLLAGDARLAALMGADGVHLRAFQRSGKAPGSRLIFSAACHSAADLGRAAATGADVALLSPVFPTQSHPGTEHLGPERFRRLARGAQLPVLALGGVDAINARRLKGANVAGFAAIGAFGAGCFYGGSSSPPAHSRESGNPGSQGAFLRDLSPLSRE